MRSGSFRGEGPGAQTRDGCSVEVYRLLPHAGEVDLIAPWLGRSVLELGCGVGRLTAPMIARGCRVTAVDDSPEMLAHVPAEAAKVRSSIEELGLDARFDTVLLASHLINVPSAAQRSALVATAYRHLRAGGNLVFQRHDPSWLARAAVGRLGDLGEVEAHLDRLERRADRIEMSLRFRAGEREWLHHFATVALDDDQARALLGEAGFGAPEWIDRRWGSARKP
jgi:SAM-dependent methyltransferase